MDWGFTVTIFFTIGFGIATIVLALKLTKGKKPVWAYKTKRIIGLGTDAPTKLKLYYGNRPIDNFYQTKLIFFNKGNEPIRQHDVTGKVTFLFKEAKILRQPVVQTKSSEAISLSAKQMVKQAEDSIQLDFLYLDYNDGAVVEVTHTESKGIDCVGNIIGAKRIVNIGNFEETCSRRSGFWTITLLVVLVISASTWALQSLKVLPFSEEQKVLSSIVGGIMAFLVGLAGGGLYSLLPPYLRCRKFPSWSRSK